MMKNYIPLHAHTHYSMLDGLSKCSDIKTRLNSLEMEACAITDHGNVHGHIDFLNTMTKDDKDDSRLAGKLRPLLGCELYICKDSARIRNNDNRSLSHLPVIAANDKGWQDLMKLTSESNHPDNFYYKPRLSLEEAAHYFNGNIKGFSGHLGSDVSNTILPDGTLNPDWKKDGIKKAKEMESYFGKGNFYLEVQLMDSENCKEQKIVGECVREIAKATGIPTIATPDAHYSKKEDAELQRIILCMGLRMKMAQGKASGMKTFFNSDNFHIPSYEEMIRWNTEGELERTYEFADGIEYNNILKKPSLPHFKCQNGMDEKTYLRKLCNDGLHKLIPTDKHGLYEERLNKELAVFEDAGLSAYFLIVQDIVDFVNKNDWLPGPGRGSAAGCLVSYLIGITSIDPISYNLIFERFYNAGRNTADRVSMPDIDVDVPSYKRDEIIEYIKKKYGRDRVSQIVTFQNIKAKTALKGVFSAYDDIPFETQNIITKHIIDDHKISDDLQEMKEERGSASILQWCLENRADKLKEWCYIGDDGKLHGQYAHRFAQAMALEGTRSAVSKHAGGIVIGPDKLENICPMIKDPKSDNMITAFEMNDAEAVSLVKLDVLGVALLDKVMGIQDIMTFGDITR